MKTKLLVGCIALLYSAAFIHFAFWKTALFGGDSWGYYVHLPATFIYHDTGAYDQSAKAREVYNAKGKDPLAEIHQSPIGKRVIKYPVGVAIMEAPFFLLAHVVCLVTGTPADGFSPPYMFLVGISSLVYAMLGIWILLLALKRYFPEENIRLLLALMIGLGTNLFYSATYTVGMSHPYLFFLYAVLLLGTIRFYDTPSYKHAAWVGAAVGGIALTRSPEAICVLIPLLWGISRWADIPKRFRFVGQHFSKIALSVLAAVLVLLPQAMYWKYISGEWWYYGYKGEKFFWDNPRILDGLFHFHNGWLIYTPIMGLALLGIFWLRKRAADALLPILAFLPLHWYIIYSWWCWNYINGFGSRPMIEVAALLSFPLAALSAVMWRKPFSRGLLLGLTAFFIWLNLFQTWQVSKGLLLTEVNNSAYYRAIFGRTTSDDAAAIAFNSNELQPEIVRSTWQKILNGDKDTLTKVRVLDTNEMEDSTSALFTRTFKRNGNFGFRCDDEFSPGIYLESADSMQLRPGDYLRLEVSTYVKADEMQYEYDKLAMLSVNMFDADGKSIKYAQVSASARTQNTDGSFWHTGVPNVWGNAVFFVKIPQGFKPPDRIKVYVWNPARQRIFLDDLRLEHWRYQ